jgi:hypothetical protein
MYLVYRQTNGVPGNVVTFFTQNHIFLRILFRWPNVICCYLIQLKNVLVVGMGIFGFCQYQASFIKKDGMTTLPTRRVKSSLPYIPV